MKLSAVLLPLLTLPFLGACTDDAASHMIDGRFNALSLAREQPYFWESKVKYYLIVSRLPDCQRKHFMVLGDPLAKTELWDMGGGTFLLRQSNKMYVTENRTCEGFAHLPEVPEQGMGTLLGAFQEKEGEFRFKAAPTPAKPIEVEAELKPTNDR
jgi:hypothetical protein